MASISFSKGDNGQRVELETTNAHARVVFELYHHLSIIVSEGRGTTVAVEDASEETRAEQQRLLTLPFADMRNASMRYNTEGLKSEGASAHADEYKRTYLHWKETGELVIRGIRSADTR